MHIIRKLIGSHFFKSLAILASGSLIGTAITAACEVGRTWIFPAENLGIYTLLLTFPHLFIAIPSFRYDISIIVEKDERKTLALVKLSLILMLLTSTAVTLGDIIFLFGFHAEYSAYWYTIPLCFFVVCGYGLNNVLNAYSNRRKEYKEISQKYVIRTAAQNITTIILGMLIVKLLQLPEWSVLILYIPHGLGLFIGTWKQSASLRKQEKEIRSLRGKELMEAAKIHRKQLLFSTPALFINNYSYSVISLLVEDLFDATTLAYYGISNRVLGIPIALISGNVSKVYIEEAAKEYNATGKFIKAFKKTILFLVAMAIPMLLGMYFVAPLVCESILGPGWGIAGEYIKILAVMFSFRLIGTAMSQSLVVCNRQGIELIVNICLVIASLLSGVITRQTGGDIYSFLTLICIFRSACYVLLITGVLICALGKMGKRREQK